MADKRRKRPAMMAATASHCDNSSRDFHVVSIGDSDAQVPRRRSASAGRSESWMTKVTSAVSHRIFSGRRLSASRSTQVMPMLHGNDHKDGDDGVNEGGPQRTRGEMLRLVASEATLPRPSGERHEESHRRTGSECPTVVCDIDPDALGDDDLEISETDSNRSKCSVNTIHVGSPQRLRSQSQLTVEKVHPRSTRDDNDTPAETDVQRRRQHSAYESTTRDSEPLVQDTAPILKDFFSRSATKTQRDRAQQRESRREQHYGKIKQRHERLRAQSVQDQQAQEENLQREKIGRLRKLNQQRRQQLMQEAAHFKGVVVAEGQSAQNRFETERERWENAFEDEIRTLGQAYRKASSKIGGDERPMTVAGLAVPEALTQIQREASNHERRLKTAAPAGWSSLELAKLGLVKGPTTKESNVLHVENSPEVFEVFGAEADVDGLSGSEGGVSVEELLAERRVMAQRISELEQQLRESKLRATVESGKAQESQPDEGFFI